ncbi:MAG: PilW family protein [Pseudomonadales bacterium]|nr:PilW family protein [Pseudomonadales bacterium]
MRRYRHCNGGFGSARGFSLIELMVSIVLGLIIIAGAASIYLASKRSMTEVEQVAAVSENGRFALQLLNSAVRHVSFFGGSRPPDIRDDASLGAVTGDCNAPADAYNTDESFFAVRATGTPGSSVSVLGCITDALANTDVLVIKGVAPSPLYDADPDDPNAPRDGNISFPTGAWSSQESYVVSNSESGILVDGADTPRPSVAVGTEFALGVAWPYRLQIYYIRNIVGGIPTLARKVLAWDTASGTMSIQTQDLVQGVENIRYLFSYDSDGDGEVDTTSSLTDMPGATDLLWSQVISLQVYLLVRSDAADPDYLDEKTYNLGDISYTPTGDARSVRRILLNSDIAMRNPRLVLRGGA